MASRVIFPVPRPPQAAGEALTHGGLPVEVFEKHGDDTVIDVEVTSNRGDCLSHAAWGANWRRCSTGRSGREPAAKESADAASAVAAVRIEAADLCPHYTARLIRGVKIGPSPAWLVRRLEAIGLRAINNVVDVTNYVHVRDGPAVARIRFRQARRAPDHRATSDRGRSDREPRRP